MLTIGESRWRVFKGSLYFSFNFSESGVSFQNKKIQGVGRNAGSWGPPLGDSGLVSVDPEWGLGSGFFLRRAGCQGGRIFIWPKASPSQEVLPATSSSSHLSVPPMPRRVLPSLGTFCSLCLACCPLVLCLTSTLFSGLSPDVTSSEEAS